MNEKQIKEKISQIVNDKISGSTYIASNIEKIFPQIPEKIFMPTIRKLLESHSSMASIINKINYLCLQKEGKAKHKEIDVSKKTYQTFWNENQKRRNWITLSMSYSVIECFKYNTVKQNIILGISYPDKEGLKSFDELKGFHNPIIYEDNKLSSEIEHSDGVILGADLITKKYIINKTGSFSLSLAANFFNKPLYIISSGDKFLNKDLIQFFNLKIQAKKSQMIHYFDQVPKKLVTKIYFTSQRRDFPLSKTLKQILQCRINS